MCADAVVCVASGDADREWNVHGSAVGINLEEEGTLAEDQAVGVCCIIVGCGGGGGGGAGWGEFAIPKRASWQQ